MQKRQKDYCSKRNCEKLWQSLLQDAAMSIRPNAHMRRRGDALIADQSEKTAINICQACWSV